MSEGRYEAYPEYKDSGLPWMTVVPAHWSEVRFKHVLADKKKNLRPDLPAGSISFGRVVYKDAEILSNETKAAYQEVLSGEFLVNPLNLNYDLMSLRTALSSIDVVVSTGYIVLQSSGRLNPNYTRWLLQQFDVAHMKTLGAGVRQTINFADIGNSFFFEPSLSEQTQIAAFLDHETAKIDRLIEKQRALISLLKEKRQAVISHAVTKGLNPHAPLKDSGIEWLGQIPAHWSVSKLSYRYEVLLGKMLDDKKITGNYLGRYLRNTDVQWWRINTDELPVMDFRPDERERFSVKKGDLLVCEGGEIGRCAIWENSEPCFYQKAIHRLRPVSDEEDISKYFAYVLFKSVHEERFISGAGKSTIAHLPAETFKQYRFAFPPHNEQAEITVFLDKMMKKFDSIEDSAISQITLLQERRTALISASVTGKIDVRHWQPTAGLNGALRMAERSIR